MPDRSLHSSLFRNVNRALPWALVLAVGLWICDAVAGGPDVLLDYRQHISLVSEADNAIHIQVFADGTAQAHFPAFMRRAGDYRMQLGGAELEQLMADMVSLGLDRFDPHSVAVQIKREIAAASERSITHQQLRIVRTDPNLVQVRMATDEGSMHAFTFRGAKSQSSLYPQVTALKDLAEAMERLNQLARDTRMQKHAESE